MLMYRPASIDDLELLKYWDTQPHVKESNPNDPWDWENELRDTPDCFEHIIAEFEGQPIGFIQIMDPARDVSQYWGKVSQAVRAIDIWIGEKDFLGKGYGTMMMHHAIQRCFQDPKVVAILIDPLASNQRAHRFYEKLGFQFLEDRQFGDDFCFVYQLERDHYFSKILTDTKK